MSASNEITKVYRILYIHSTQVPPPIDESHDRFSLFSRGLSGEIIQPIWRETPEAVEEEMGAGAYPFFSRGRFRYHWILLSTNKFVYSLRRLSKYIFHGWKLHREKKIDCIVAYSHMTTGLCGVILKALTGAKLIIEIVTSPEHAYLAESPRPSLTHRIMHLYSEFCLMVCMTCCDRVHLLASQQLRHYKRYANVRRAVFPDFINGSQLEGERDLSVVYMLLVGAPWYLKGADLAIRAFRRIERDFPDVRFKLLGHFPDREELDALVGDSQQIDILRARPFNESVPIIRNASFMVLPSRCEGVPRVLMEAMAVGMPAIASDLGGIPSLVRDGENGYLIPPNDVDALEQRMRAMLSDEALRARMGARGKEIAQSEFTEARYVERFIHMVNDTVEGAP